MNAFDKAAETWDANSDILLRNKRIGAELLRRIPLDKTMSALDYGAGTGLMSVFLSDYVKSVTAIDTSEGMLDVLQSKLEKSSITNVRTQLIEAGSVQNIRGPYHLVFTGMTLHHVAEVETVLKRFAEITAPNGCIAIADLVSDGGKFHGDRDDVYHHGFVEEKLMEDLSSHGFTGLESGHVHSFQRKQSGGAEAFPVFLITGKHR